ncbi:ADP-ribosylglycohydrolase family protein [Saccharibacillus endophyticus]|uniref:ADP-ribosylglycohydrolase family protein n=1 Tax=Saccharibacillus endophyticus TaxID=2060666 RepID=A0ABQ2A0R9_9BACL|nr:ADP-ribosylglycohydrolase family protein [Saccharibacillus endophyticus]GGH81780.1 hypothetical protein GCM10007362_32100 [Saccharibacillus endophyticus]
MPDRAKIHFIDKKIGCFLGAAVGDSLGWPQEDRGSKIESIIKPQLGFQRWTRKSGGQYYSHNEEILEGSYSDDTQLILSTARSLRYSNWFSHFVRVELPSWPLYERGGGGATKRAAQTWSNGSTPWNIEKQGIEKVKNYFNAGGNGVVMRILPHAMLPKKNIEEIASQVFLNGISTHGHPRALLSAIMYAFSLNYLMKKDNVLGYGEIVDYLIETKNEWGKQPTLNNMNDWIDAAKVSTNARYDILWSQTLIELMDGLEIARISLKRGILDNERETLTKLSCFDKKTRGAGTVAALVSIYMASKYASNPLKGLLEISFLKDTDADTNASLVGALFGAIHGTEWITPDWLIVQDFNYIRELSNALELEENLDTKPKLWSFSDNKRIKEKLPQLNINEKIHIGPFNDAKLVKIINHKSNVKNVIAKSYKFETTDGQTIYLKAINKQKVVESINRSIPVPSIASKEEVLIDKKEKHESPVQFSIEDLERLLLIMPSKMYARKFISIIIEILKSPLLNRIKTGNEKEISEFCSRFIQKGISENDILKIVEIIIKNR